MRISRLLTQQRVRDDQPLNFGRALVDAQRAHRAIQALDGMADQHAAAAGDLHGLVDDALRRFGGEALGHGGVERDALAPTILRHAAR